VLADDVLGQRFGLPGQWVAGRDREDEGDAPQFALHQAGWGGVVWCAEHQVGAVVDQGVPGAAEYLVAKAQPRCALQAIEGFNQWQ